MHRSFKIELKRLKPNEKLVCTITSNHENRKKIIQLSRIILMRKSHHTSKNVNTIRFQNTRFVIEFVDSDFETLIGAGNDWSMTPHIQEINGQKRGRLI